jgi:hypothetical protein
MQIIWLTKLQKKKRIILLNPKPILLSPPTLISAQGQLIYFIVIIDNYLQLDKNKKIFVLGVY